MRDVEKRAAAKAFARYWEGRGDEKGESQKFWLSLLEKVLGVNDPEQFIEFEDRVFLGHTSFIDGYIPKTKVLIEQKKLGKSLDEPIRQSDGTLLSPFQQAKRYAAELPYSKRPRWIVTCNFSTFHVYDMEKPGGEPEVIELKNLEKEYYRLSFLADSGNENLKREMEVSIAAGDLVGILYDALLKQYKDPANAESQKSLNMLCVRLVFCLYAEDAGVFGTHTMFHDYMMKYPAEEWREKLIQLFHVLDQTPETRDPYLNERLAAFPYVNGGLFSDEPIEIPNFTEEIRNIILQKASEDFDWSEISPTIFGAVFESTLNPETRRSGGMHYTSIENIHKVIDPLFLNELKTELEEIKEVGVKKTREKKLLDFQNKLASLTFLDPACGSGNFLTESYISIRRLENEVLKELSGGQITLGEVFNPIKCSIEQFYGIEINDFAVTVAKTALWIAENQMMKETEDIVHMELEFLPLKTNATIIEGNALRMDWSTLHEEPKHPLIQAKKTNLISPDEIDETKMFPVSVKESAKYEVVNLVTEELHVGREKTATVKNHYDYIMGNPPFVGYSLQSKAQKDDIHFVAPKIGSNVDYVALWYYKASEIIAGTKTKAAFVSTNSITQGEQVAVIWEPLFEKYKIHIDFAYRTFRWDSEASLKAHVHCVIIGFSTIETEQKMIYLSDHTSVLAENISPYLLDAPTVFVKRQKTPLCNIPAIYRGSQPTDNGNLILTEDEKSELISREPLAEKYIRPYMMGKDFIDRKYRYCLWLDGADPMDLKKCPLILERVKKVKEFRLKSKKTATRRKAETPTLFDENHACETDYIAIPKVSSENRRYIPMELLPAEVIAGDKLFMLPNASLYHFGVLTSNVHMAWMRAVCGRLKSDYSYSNTIVYNNFPWCNPTTEQREKIEKTAQMILDARAKYPNSSLAALYDELTMPPELRKAHQENDKAVMRAYGFSINDTTESSCVAELMKLYEKKSSSN